MDDEYKPLVEHQHRLNLTMKAVVKKEVLKLLDAGLIYLISNGQWLIKYR